MVCIRIKDHELLVWDWFVKTSLIFSTQSVFEIQNALFWIHWGNILYLKMIPLQEQKYLKVFLHFKWQVSMPVSYLCLLKSFSLTERPQTNLEKTKHNKTQKPVLYIKIYYNSRCSQQVELWWQLSIRNLALTNSLSFSPFKSNHPRSWFYEWVRLQRKRTFSKTAQHCFAGKAYHVLLLTISC